MKGALRKHFRNLREAIPAPRRRAAALAIANKMRSVPQWAEAHTVLLYASFGSEVDTAPLFEEAERSKKEVALPRMEGLDLVIHVVAQGDELVVNRHGIPEPRLGTQVAVAENIGLVAVPGVAFDRRGARLGYGGGYYDRLLRTVPHAFRVGIAYESLVVDRLPTTHLDVPMDALVTESNVHALPRREH